MGLLEYLYVDEKRLDSYFEQISSPITYDKIPTWKISLNLTGPTVEGGHERQSRQFTKHEKITTLLKHLEKNGLVDTYRPSGRERWDTAQVFRLETCRALRVFIPPKPESSSSFSGLGLWISYAPHPKHNRLEGGPPTGALYLLEDFRHDDSNFVDYLSSFSALYVLIDEVRTEMDDTVAGEALIENRRNPAGISFSLHPDKFLAALGGQVGPARLVQCLYRIRTTLNDSGSQPRNAVVTIGYPIFMVAVDSD
jgi:hypothetical protein